MLRPATKDFFKMHGWRNVHETLTPDMVERAVKVNRDVNVSPEDAKRIIPYPHATAIILSTDQEMAIMECPCRKVKEIL